MGESYRLEPGTDGLIFYELKSVERRPTPLDPRLVATLPADAVKKLERASKPRTYVEIRLEFQPESPLAGRLWALACTRERFSVTARTSVPRGTARGDYVVTEFATPMFDAGRGRPIFGKATLALVGQLDLEGIPS